MSTTGAGAGRGAAKPEAASRRRMLDDAWSMIEQGRLADLTMGAVAAAAGVSRQTAYVQFGTRAGLLVQMVRERDDANPRREQVAAATAVEDPVEALLRLTRILSGWWQDIHPIARALHAAALTDDGARAAWEDRMAHLHDFAGAVVARLADAGVLAAGWEVDPASDWLAAELNPLGWDLLVNATGWEQHAYEERMATVVQAVLVEPAAQRPVV